MALSTAVVVAACAYYFYATAANHAERSKASDSPAVSQPLVATTVDVAPHPEPTRKEDVTPSPAWMPDPVATRAANLANASMVRRLAEIVEKPDLEANVYLNGRRAAGMQERLGSNPDMPAQEALKLRMHAISERAVAPPLESTGYSSSPTTTPSTFSSSVNGFSGGRSTETRNA